MSCFIVVDCGTSSCRAAMVSESGRILNTVRKPVQIESPGPRFAEVDTEHVWRQVCAALIDLRDQGPPHPVAAIGVSAMLGYVPLDRQAQPLTSAAIWMDNRAAAQTARILERIPESTLYRKTGRKPTPELLAPRLLWMREHRPEIYTRMETVIGLKDDIVRRLTGVVITDPAHLDYSLVHNIAEQRLDKDILAALEIPSSIFPAARRADQPAGKLSAAAARATGLTAGTPVAAGSSDGTTAMYGSGILDKHSAVLVAGTTDVLMAATGAPVEDPQQVLSVNTAMLPGHYLAGGAMGMSGGTVAQLESLFKTTLDSHASTITALPPGCDGLMVLPGISGERAPYWLEDVSGGVLGLRKQHRIEHILRATMESTAYRSAAMLDIMRRSGIRVEKVRVVGGTARNDTWNQIRADVWGKAVEKPDVEEATLLGAAMFCYSAMEPDRGLKDIAREWITVKKRYRPDEKAYATYARLSKLFSQFVKHNAGFFKALGRTTA